MAYPAITSQIQFKLTYTVYILQCVDGSYYTGLTSNLIKRMAEHDAGLHINSYTYTRRPVTLVYQEQHSDPNYASKREKQIKGWSRRKKIAMIEGRWGDLPGLAKGKQRKY